MAVNGFNVVHALIFNRGLFGEFALLLLLPGYTGGAARHRIGHAVVDLYQFCTVTLLLF
jgi:hypothetical protein